ncbi:IQ domain-containing protein C [Aythya fuligula]|uniref:IQ domain-containing protein C n=1 Tax=Aythya fuligula TaxID=219594 RepID=A0A6J3E3T6_AYTFU|nr:IQ domain-containing protein C [Aythya fuligula]
MGWDRSSSHSPTRGGPPPVPPLQGRRRRHLRHPPGGKQRGPGPGPSPFPPLPSPAAILWAPMAGRVTPSAGARCPAVMAAVAEAEQWRRLLGAVTRLQACVRGWQLRRRFRSLQQEYEEVVREIEGDLSELQWTGRYLPRPVFVPKNSLQGKCSAVQESVPSDKASTEKTEQELDASEPERDWGCSSSVKPPAQLQIKEDPSSLGECDVARPPNPGAEADKSTAKGCSALAESEEWQNSSVSSVWDSTVHESESLEACLEIPLEDIKELPRTRAGLQSYRNHLIMELLWLQQAIVSRKNYLKLKQRLGTPDP